jgi:formate dehydrogenase major subunit
MDYKSGICNLCGTGCGNLFRISDGKVQGVFPLEKHPFSKGRLCVRGWHVHEMLKPEGRITGAMIKKGDSFTRVSMDEAVKETAKRLSALASPAADLGFIASPRSSNEEIYLLMKLARSVFKTGNIAMSSDYGHRESLDIISSSTGMAGMTGSLEDIKKCGFILVVGGDITKQNPIIGSEIHMAKEKGAKLVTISASRTQIAKLSSRHLRAVPGTQAVLLAGLGKVMIEEGLCDINYIQKKTRGFEEYANGLGSMSIDEIAVKCGVPALMIRETARELAASPSAMAFFPSGISGLDRGTIAAICNLFILAGKAGGEGSGINPVTGICNIQGGYDMGAAPDLLPGFVSINDADAVKKLKSVWNTDFNASSGRAPVSMTGGPVENLKALVIVDHDDGIIRNEEQLKKMDLVVYIGSFENKIASYAHIVLPSAAYIETTGTYTNTERRVQLVEQMLPVPAGAAEGWRLIADIAAAAGAVWKYKTASDVMDEIALVNPDYSGISHGLLKAHGSVKWPCSSQKPRGTARFDQALAETLRFTAGTPSAAYTSMPIDFPFRLTTAKAVHFWHHNNLMKRTWIPKREYNATLLLYPEGYVEISPSDAKMLGVRDKAPVKVTSASGSMTVQARVTDEAREGTASIPYYIQEMINRFLIPGESGAGEDGVIPIRIERV